MNYGPLFLQADNLRNNGQVDEAIAAYQDIAALASNDGELSNSARAWHMAGVSAKSSIHGLNQYYEQAQTFFANAERIYRQLNDIVSLGQLYRDMAITDGVAGKQTEALTEFQKSIELLDKAEALDELAVTYDKLGLLFYKNRRYVEGLAYADKALSLLRQYPLNGFYRATTLLDRSRILFKLDRIDEAYEDALEAYSWFQADHGREQYDHRKAQLSGVLSVITSAKGNAKESSGYLRTYQQLCRRLDPLVYRVIQEELGELAAS